MAGNNLDVTDDCYYREGDAGQTWKPGPRAEVGGGCLIMCSLSDKPCRVLPMRIYPGIAWQNMICDGI